MFEIMIKALFFWVGLVITLNGMDQVPIDEALLWLIGILGFVIFACEISKSPPVSQESNGHVQVNQPLRRPPPPPSEEEDV